LVSVRIALVICNTFWYCALVIEGSALKLPQAFRERLDPKLSSLASLTHFLHLNTTKNPDISRGFLRSIEVYMKKKYEDRLIVSLPAFPRPAIAFNHGRDERRGGEIGEKNI
jgi:hypothetical protein